MPPVPVHRSKTRNVRGAWVELDRSYFLISNAKAVVYSSVSGLGIKTPFRHNISSSPNGCVPRIYCRGSPFALRSTNLANKARYSGTVSRTFLVFVRASWEPFAAATATACSFSHLSSFRADTRSRHSRRSRGRRTFSREACRRKFGRRRGIQCSPSGGWW